MITPQEIAELATKKYGKCWQSKMAREVQAMTGCKFRSALITIHRLNKGHTTASPFVEVALKLLLDLI